MNTDNKNNETEQCTIPVVSKRLFDVYYETNNNGFFGGGRTTIEANTKSEALSELIGKVDYIYKTEVLNVC